MGVEPNSNKRQDHRFDKCKLLEKLALGSESVLYLGQCGDQQVCVKAIRNWMGKLLAPSVQREHTEKVKEVSYSSKFRHLRNEFEIGKKLEREGPMPIVRMYALHQVRPCFVELGYNLLMEYIDGDDLGDRRAVQMFSLADKVNYFYQAALALRYIHQMGYVHMDIKPSNIMVSGGVAKLIDFGMTSLIGERPRALVGTAGYLSPEQLVCDIADEATDIFALGVAFNVIFGGRPLRQHHDDLKDKLTRMEAKFHLATLVTPLISQVPEAKSVPELESLIVRCTIPKRESRIRNTSTLINGIHLIAKDLRIKLPEFEY